MQMMQKQQEEQNQKQSNQSGFIQKTPSIYNVLGRIMRAKLNRRITLSAYIILLTVLKINVAFHTLITHFLINNTTKVIFQNYIQILQNNSLLFILIQTLLYTIKFSQLATICSLLGSNKQTIFTTLFKFIQGNLSLLTQLDLSLSSLLLLFNFQQNLFGFLITTAAYLFNAIFLSNYFDRKDILYLSSIKGSFFIHAVIIISYLFNSISKQYCSQEFVWIDLGLSSIILVWYMKRGFYLTLNIYFKHFLANIVIIKVSNCLIFIDYFFNKQEILPINFLTKFVLFYCIIYLTFSITSNFTLVFQSLRINHNASNIKTFDGLLSIIVNEEQNVNHQQRDYLIKSTIKYHQDVECHSCKTNYPKYDPVNNCYSSEENKNREIQLKFYLKCLYQKLLSENSQNIQFILDYCEFILNQFNSPYQICKLISGIPITSIGFWEKIRLQKIRYLTQQSIQILNRIVFDGKLELQNMMMAEQCFEKISYSIQKYIKINYQVWGMINKDSINFTQIREKINNNFQLIQQTNNAWQNIYKYLKYQKRWRYIYINYTCFILNQKIHNKDREQLKTMSQDDYFIGETIFLYEKDKKSTLLNQKILFNKNTVYIHASFNANDIQIINVSKYFQKFAEYTDIEIIGCTVDILMTAQVKQIHKEKVREWLQKGYSSNQVFYNPIFTCFLTKSGAKIPVVKYYKMFISLQSAHILQFICLLKINQHQELQFEEMQSEYQTQRPINIKEMKKQFLSNKQKQLKIQNNIFLKDESLQTNEKILQIQLAKKSIRLLTFSIISLLIIIILITNIDTKIVTNNIIQFLNFLNLYRFPMALSKNYMKNFLNVGTQSSVISQIKLGTQNVQAFNSDPLTLMTLFDQNLNERYTYTPFQNDSFNKGISYTQIQIYQTVISSIISLSKLPINRTGYDFTMLNMYLIPSYDHMINKTKIKFHQTFEKNLNSMFVDQIIIACVKFAIFIVIIIFVCIQIKVYLKKSRNILEIVFQFSDINGKRIKKYWSNMLKHFQKLDYKNRAYCQSTIIDLKTAKSIQINLDIDFIKSNIQKQQNISFNKKSKMVFQSKKAKGKFNKYVTIIGVSLLFLLISLLSIQIFNIIQIGNLVKFQKDGYYFLQYYPATSVLGHALLERYYNQLYPKQIKFFPKRYSEYISDMRLIGESKYINQIIDPTSSYYQKQKNYMFGNPCTFSPDVLVAANSNLAKCLSIYDRTLANGLTTFLRAAQSQVQNYINTNMTLTSTQLDTLTSALTLVAFFVTDAITTWASQFSTKVNNYKQQGNIICIVVAVIVFILHLIFCESILFYYLSKDYRFVRDVYDKMVPEYILSSEKVCMQKFIMEGIIKQS